MSTHVILYYLIVAGVKEVDSIFLSLVVEVGVESRGHKVQELLTRCFSIIHFKENHL